jgi:hypothetical protein
VGKEDGLARVAMASASLTAGGAYAAFPKMDALNQSPSPSASNVIRRTHFLIPTFEIAYIP